MLIAMAHKGKGSLLGLETRISDFEKLSPHSQIILNFLHSGKITELIHDMNNFQRLN